MSKAHREQLKGRLIRNEAGTEDYRDFQIRCVRKFGPAAGLFLHQLVYWVGKEHDEEGWIYKTQREMEEETGLSRRSQREARKILGSNGVLREKRQGIPYRLWFWVDLEALSRIMETPYSTMNQRKRKQGTRHAQSSQDDITDLSWEADSTDPANEYINTDHASEYDNSVPTSEASISDQAITESTSETTAESSSDNYSAENENLQFSEDQDSRGLSPHQDMKIDDPPQPSVGGLELNRIYYLLDDSNSAAYRAYECHREGKLSLVDLASEICFALTGSRDEAESYVEPVRRMVAEFAMDDNADEPPPGGRQNHVP